ncbi:hypothetical protein FACS189421_11750 [Bacteroidia bacterium]|nr:hypothetical protein FACS189421_11750 [Bacteroidia bacterium]
MKNIENSSGPASVMENLESMRRGAARFLESENTGALRLVPRQQLTMRKLAQGTAPEDAKASIVLPPKTGKTYVMAALIRSFEEALAKNPRAKVLIMEPLQAVLRQVKTRLEELTDKKVGAYWANSKTLDTQCIITTWASLRTLVNDPGFNRNEVALILGDECHNSLSELRTDLLCDFPNALVYAFTATPSYSDVKNLYRAGFSQLDTMEISEAVELDMIPSQKNLLLKIGTEDLSKIRKTLQGEWDPNALNRRINFTKQMKAADQVANFYKDFVDSESGKRACDRLAIINCPTRRVAQSQLEALNKLFGYEIARLYLGNMPNDKRIALEQEFQAAGKNILDGIDQQFRILVQCNALTEGIDNKYISLAINYPTASAVREGQSSGRPSSPNPEDPDKVSWVVDMIYMHPKYPNDPFASVNANNQVIYGHIMGAMEITKDYVRIAEESGRIVRRRRRRELDPKDRPAKPRNISGEKLEDTEMLDFAVISSAEDLEKISRKLAKHRLTDPTERPEGSWTPAELTQIFPHDEDEIRKNLKLLYDGNVRMVGWTPLALHLLPHKEALNREYMLNAGMLGYYKYMFKVLTKAELDEYPQMNDSWMITPAKISAEYNVSEQKAIILAQQWINKRRNWTKITNEEAKALIENISSSPTKQSEDAPISAYVQNTERKNLTTIIMDKDEFVKRAKLQLRLKQLKQLKDAAHIKTNDDFTADDLFLIYAASRKELFDLLKHEARIYNGAGYYVKLSDCKGFAPAVKEHIEFAKKYNLTSRAQKISDNLMSLSQIAGRFSVSIRVLQELPVVKYTSSFITLTINGEPVVRQDDVTKQWHYHIDYMAQVANIKTY